jgi:hypothetical protein
LLATGDEITCEYRSAPVAASHARSSGSSTAPVKTTPGIALVGAKLASPSNPLVVPLSQRIAPVSMSRACMVGRCGL